MLGCGGGAVLRNAAKPVLRVPQRPGAFYCILFFYPPVKPGVNFSAVFLFFVLGRVQTESKSKIENRNDTGSKQGADWSLFKTRSPSFFRFRENERFRAGLHEGKKNEIKNEIKRTDFCFSQTNSRLREKKNEKKNETKIRSRVEFLRGAIFRNDSTATARDSRR